MHTPSNAKALVAKIAAVLCISVLQGVDDATTRSSCFRYSTGPSVGDEHEDAAEPHHRRRYSYREYMGPVTWLRGSRYSWHVWE